MPFPKCASSNYISNTNSPITHTHYSSHFPTVLLAPSSSDLINPPQPARSVPLAISGDIDLTQRISSLSWLVARWSFYILTTTKVRHWDRCGFVTVRSHGDYIVMPPSPTWVTQSHYPDIELTSPCPILIMQRARLGSDKCKFDKSLL